MDSSPNQLHVEPVPPSQLQRELSIPSTICVQEDFPSCAEEDLESLQSSSRAKALSESFHLNGGPSLSANHEIVELDDIKYSERSVLVEEDGGTGGPQNKKKLISEEQE